MSEQIDNTSSTTSGLGSELNPPSEPSTTRPKPFDDDDAASRKRRRTSTSVSPVPSLNAEATSSESAEKPQATEHDMADAGQLGSTQATPSTPEQPIPVAIPSSHASSSRVTINLRRPDLSPSSEVQTTTGSAEAQSSNEQVKQSVEMDTDHLSKLAGEESGNNSSSNEDVAAETAAFLLIDPIERFPYSDRFKTLDETLHSFVHYLVSDSDVDTAILEELQDWIGLCLAYIEQVDDENLFKTCKGNTQFWIEFPQVIRAVLSRQSDISKSSTLREVTSRLYVSFSQLTMRLVRLDQRLLSSSLEEFDQNELPNLSLFSLNYQQQLHSIVESVISEESTAAIMYQQSVIAQIMTQVHAGTSGNIEDLIQLAESLIELAKRFPKYSNALLPVCQVFSRYACHSKKTLDSTDCDVQDANARLKRSFDIWLMLSSSFEETIDKHMSQLDSDQLLQKLPPLSRMLKACLFSRHPVAVSKLETFVLDYPDLPAGCSAEAFVWGWKLGILIKFVKSPQMQVRVIGVTTICTELVQSWKRLGSSLDEGHEELLRTFGKQLLCTNLIQYIIGSSYSPEIIMDSANIVGFLAITDLYGQTLADFLWSGIVDSQDPRIAESIARMMSTISNLLSEMWLLDLCLKFRSFPMDDFTLGTLFLLDAILRDLIAKTQADKSLRSTVPIHLCCDLLVESSQAHSNLRLSQPELHKICQTRLKELLACSPDSQAREDIYSRCIEGITDGSNKSIGNLWCLSAAIRPSLGSEFEKLADNRNFVRLLVEELKQSTSLPGNPDKAPLFHGDLNCPRRDFVSLIIRFRPGSLDGKIGQDLWDLLVGKLVVNEQDRPSGWQILTGLLGKSDEEDTNSFVQTCYERYMPELLPPFFCEGMLQFTREKILLAINDASEADGDEMNLASNPGVKSIWRVVLEAKSEDLADQAIRILVTDVYIDSRIVTFSSPQKVRQVHLQLVKQCLHQMESAAKKIRAADGDTASLGSKKLALVTADHFVPDLEREFARSLRLLRTFVEEYQARPRFSSADSRPLAAIDDLIMQGCPAGLKYQSFNGSEHTGVKPLLIGVDNNAGSLFARLRLETGFENYSVYYRGKLFAPSERDIHKSLQDLRIHEGLILIKKEEDQSAVSSRIKPGSSFLEIEILAYFHHFWQYLSMSDNIAKEIYQFLMRLPAEGCVAGLLHGRAQYLDFFNRQEPFKTLYTLFAFCKLLRDPAFSRAPKATEDAEEFTTLLPIISQLTLKALMDMELVEGTPQLLHTQLTSVIMDTLDNLLRAVFKTEIPTLMAAVGEISHERLLGMMRCTEGLENENSPLVIAKAFRVSLLLGANDERFWTKLTQDTRFEQISRHLCLLDVRRQLRLLAIEAIVDTTNQEAQLANDRQGSLLEFFWRVTFGLLDEALQLPEQSFEWFKLTERLLESTHFASSQTVNLESISLTFVVALLAQHPHRNDTNNASKKVTHTGLVNLLHTCIRIDPTAVCVETLFEQINQSIEDKTTIHIVSNMFWKYLFPITGQNGIVASDDIIHDEETRSKLVDILMHLFSQADTEHATAFFHSLNDVVPYFVDDGNDPYDYDLPFQFDRTKALKQPGGYVGLVNLSNTCYLNSLLTQLFMNVTFRQFMLKLELGGPESSQKLLFYTQSVFGHLQNGIQRSVEPIDFVRSIKTYDDSAIDVHNQMDVDEFYNLLFDRWEDQMPGDKEKKTFRAFYGGQLVQQVKSKECEHISERLDSFSAIQCDIKGKRTLEESLQAYVDGETMEGDNKYKCTSCDNHVDAVKRTCLKDIPDHVIFHLKRFDFNLRTLQRSKINDYFSFPPNIDLHPFTVNHLSNPSDSGMTDPFELVGVLVHSGTAESGHYYSYIRERPSMAGRSPWVEFNDQNVSRWDSSQMADLTFGGNHTGTETEAAESSTYAKPYSAYMLFYQRASSLKKDMEFVNGNTSLPASVPMRSELENSIARTNNVLTRRHYMFDSKHVSFVEACCRTVLPCKQADITPDRNEHGMQDAAMNLALSFLDQVVSRADGLPDFEKFSTMIEAAVAQCGQCALTFFEYFKWHRVAFRCLLQRNTEQQVRSIMAKLLNTVWKQIAVKFPQLYFPTGGSSPGNSSNTSEEEMSLDAPAKPPPGDSVVEVTMLLFNQLWRFFQSNLRSWDEFFGAVLSFAKRGPCETSHVLAAEYLVKMFQIIAADPSMELPPNYARMVQNVMRRNYGRAVSYTSTLSLMEYLVHQLEPRLDASTIVDDPEERLRYTEAPFPWTAAEIQAIHCHPGRERGSIFIEKLLSLDREQCTTDSIVSRLVNTGDQMDGIVFFTLRAMISAEASTSDPLVPFLRWAALYITKTRSSELASLLVSHVCVQITSFQDKEGAAFMDLIRTSLEAGRDDDESNFKIRRDSMELIPDWAPLMLVYQDGQVRLEVEQLLEMEVFQRLSHIRGSNDPMDASDEDNERSTLETIVTQVGEKCVAYLIEIHVKQRVQLQRDAATSILRVIEKCSAEIQSNDAMESQDVAQFVAMREEVISAIQGVLVDTVDDDLSDWSNSGLSSTFGEEGLDFINTWGADDVV